MKKHGKIFISGVLISFFSALPLGVFNIAAFQILIGEGMSNAMFFIAGCIMAEMMYLRISLHGMHRITKYEPVLKMLSWVFLFFIVVLAISSFVTSTGSVPGNSAVFFLSDIPPFVFGFLLMGVNITQIPFWFGWNAVLFIKKILVSEQACYNVYAVGICIGSFIGYSLFIGFGRFVFRYLHGTPPALNAVLGSIFCISAIIYFLKMRSRPSGIAEEPVS